MTDKPADLPTPESLATEVSIPAALAAPKLKRGKKPVAPSVVEIAAVSAPVIEPVAVEPAPIEVVPVEAVTVEPVASAPLPEAQSFTPIAAAPSATITEEPVMATTIENVTAETTEKAQAHFADMNGRAKEAMEKTTAFFGELNGFAKGNVEALVESSKLAVAGFQSLAQDQAAYVRKHFEEATAAARSMSGVKSPTEFVKLQGDFARQQFDGAVAEMSRSTEAMLKLAGEVVQPISNRVAVAVEKIKLAA